MISIKNKIEHHLLFQGYQVQGKKIRSAVACCHEEIQQENSTLLSGKRIDMTNALTSLH